MIKGWDQWRSKLPGYQGPRVVALPLLLIGSVITGQAYLLALELLPVYRRGGLVTALEPLLPVIGTVTVLLAGFLSISRMWTRREQYLAESRETAYQRALPFGLVGLGFVFTSILNGFVPVYQMSSGALTHPLSVVLATPLPDFIPGIDSFGRGLQAWLGLVVFGFGWVQAIRSVQTFGMANAMLVYLYYPEESEMEDHAVYSVIRHPIYTGWLLWMAGGAMFRLSMYGLLDLGLFVIALIIWLRRVEEPELIERFGDEYRAYRNDVPAFIPRPGTLTDYVAFLLGRD